MPADRPSVLSAGAGDGHLLDGGAIVRPGSAPAKAKPSLDAPLPPGGGAFHACASRREK